MRWLPTMLLLLLTQAAGALEPPQVYLVVIDGLDARFVAPERMPRLSALSHLDGERTSFFPAARAVMPARTNPNHVSLLTGVHPAAHGITGNAYWSRRPGAPAEKLDVAALIEVETLFTVAEATNPELVTYGVFAKPKLGRLFAAVPGRQRAPDVLWVPGTGPGTDPVTGYATDARALDALLELMAQRLPDLAVVNLADVDRTAHAHGPDSAACQAAVAAADAATGRLVDHLRARGEWQQSVVVVTADHGFAAVGATPERPAPVISIGTVLARAGAGGAVAVSDGGVAHVYAAGLDAEAPAAGAAAGVLRRVADLARATPGVVEVMARLPVEGVPALHPLWRLGHQRAGDLLLVAARGYQFVDPSDSRETVLLGNHGGPGELAVPLWITGGFDGLRMSSSGSAITPSIVDVAPTIATLLDLRASRRLDGQPLAPADTGRTIEAVVARPVRDRTAGSSW
jgi:hypothetical protein